ncbi:MAG TPA: DUF1573 domain-containing protein [Flavitalea sp.]|nr:DUF1573 domain-containing protein [Flavitalea sp.]
MKKVFMAMAAILVSATLFAQSAAVKKEDPIKFKEMTYNFGKIKQGTPVTHEFVFENVSDKPVTIESATASCGCTTPIKPEPPIAQGKSDKIIAGFNAAAAGAFTKSIFIKVAGGDAPIELKITGEVLTADQFAKQPVKKG